LDITAARICNGAEANSLILEAAAKAFQIPQPAVLKGPLN
jgi:hypothetical protein